ncbi:hypothetical protein [Xanthobacter sediminis]
MRLALCISGQMRLFERGAASLREKLIKNNECDIFIHTWKNRGISSIAGRNYPIGVHKYILDSFDKDEWVDPNQKLTKFPSLLSAMDANGQITNELLIEHYGDSNIVIEETPHDYEERQSLFGIDYPDFLKKLNPRHFHNLAMFYKIWACNKLRIEYQNKNNIKYDYVIRARPDLIMLNDIDLSMCDRGKINQLNGGEARYVFDQFAISSPELMDVYSSVWTDLKDYWDSEKYKEIPLEERTIGRILYHHISRNGVKSTHINDFNYELDGGNLTAADVLSMIKADVKEGKTEVNDAINLSNYVYLFEEHYNGRAGDDMIREKNGLLKIGVNCEILTKYKNIVLSKNDNKIIDAGLRILTIIKSSSYVANNVINSLLKKNRTHEAISIIEKMEFNQKNKANLYVKFLSPKILAMLNKSDFDAILDKIHIISDKNPDVSIKVADAYLFFGDVGNAIKYCLICIRINNLKANKNKKIENERILTTWNSIIDNVGVDKKYLKIFLK